MRQYNQEICMNNDIPKEIKLLENNMSVFKINTIIRKLHIISYATVFLTL